MLRYKIWLLRISIIALPLLAIIFVMNLLLPSASKDYRKAQFGEDRIIFESKHFTIITQKIPDSAENIAKICEDYYENFINCYQEKIPFKKPQSKIEILVYRNRQEFDGYYQKNYLTRIPHNAAIYVPLQKRIVLYWNQHVQATLYHELTHMIFDFAVDSVHPYWSTWFNEGTATYFENTYIKDKSFVALLDMNATNYIKQAYKNKAYMPLSQLFRASSENFKSAENTIYYYQSYLLVYFLMHSEKAKAKNAFVKLFTEEMQPYDSPSFAVINILETDAESLEKDFLEYFSIRNE